MGVVEVADGESCFCCCCGGIRLLEEEEERTRAVVDMLAVSSFATLRGGSLVR